MDSALSRSRERERESSQGNEMQTGSNARRMGERFIGKAIQTKMDRPEVEYVKEQKNNSL